MIVPVYRAADTLERCLAALASAIGPDDEILVIADGETDGAWRVALGRPQTRVHVSTTSRGAAFARNLGARYAQGEVLLFVDADVEVRSDAVEIVRAAFADDAGLDALVGSYDDDPADQRFHSRYRNLLHHYVHQSADQEVQTFWGGCGAIWRYVFIEADGFDERYGGASIEDIELGYRLSNSGRQIRMLKELQVKHLKAWSARSIVKTDIFKRAAPWAELLIWNRQKENNLNLRQSARVSVVSVGLLPVAIPLAFWSVSMAVVVVFTLATLVIALNIGFYQFLARCCGVGFALRAVPWHFLYFVSCLLGVFVAIARVPSRLLERQAAPVNHPATYTHV